jgi:hypothetical protein
VSGSTFQYGDVSIAGAQVIDGLVYATGTISGDPGSYIEGDIATLDPLPVMPGLDTSSYAAALALAATMPAGDYTGDLDLGGSDIYINGKVTTQLLTGPGRLIATGAVLVNNIPTVGDDVTVISAGEIKVRDNYSAGKNVVLYSETSVRLEQVGAFDSGGTVISLDAVRIETGATFAGAVYAGGEVQVKNNAIVTGGIAADGGLKVETSSLVVHDVAAYSPTLPAGLEGGDPGAGASTLVSWEEL